MPGSVVDSIQSVSVVVVTRNNKESLARCIDSVRKQQFPGLEIIVVDNGSTDGTSTKIQTDFSGVNYYRLESDRGVGAHNRGVEEATGELIIVIADEIRMPAPTTVSRVVEKFRLNKDLGAAGFRIINENEEEIAWIPGKLEGDPQSGYFSPTVLAGAMAIRPEVFERVDGFWEPYYYHLADRDLAVRIISSDLEVRYFPLITLLQDRTIKARRGTRFNYLVTRNMLWYIWRNYSFSLAFFKSIGHLLRTAGKILTGRARPGPVLKGLVDGVLGMKKVFQTRRPVKQHSLTPVDRNRSLFGSRKG